MSVIIPDLICVALDKLGFRKLIFLIRMKVKKVKVHINVTVCLNFCFGLVQKC